MYLILLIIELTRSKTLLENSLKIKPQQTAFENSENLS